MSFHQNNTGPGMDNAVLAPVLSKKKKKKQYSSINGDAATYLH
jgi:hypothetical protein